MGFLNRDRREDDETLPGASGFGVDVEARVCPDCRREAMPWELTCPDCGAATVLPRDLPPPSFRLPGLEDDPDDRPDEGGGSDDATRR